MAQELNRYDQNGLGLSTDAINQQGVILQGETTASRIHVAEDDVTPIAGATYDKGAPVIIGAATSQIPGIAMNAGDNTASPVGYVDILTSKGNHVVIALQVAGRVDAGDSAIAHGDLLYFDVADGQINKDVTNGVLFGIARNTTDVAAGATTNIIPVQLI